jgi:putative lumazine-binding protein
MKRLLLYLAVPLLLVNISALAQQNSSSTNDPTLVSATVRNYIEAYYTGDAARMEQTLHPHYLKHVIHGDIPMREKTAVQMLSGMHEEGVPNLTRAQRTEQITVLDISGEIASAKLVTPGWTDYLTLSKSEGNWKILSVVQRIDN